MSSINVSAAHPRRLLFVQEQWTLEVQRWQALDRDLFNPVLSYIPGPENILRYLTELDHQGHLLAQAERILAHPGTPNTVFEAHDGHWIAQTAIVELPAPPQGTESGTGVLQMNQLLQQLAQLQERLERLELRLAGRIAENDAPSPSVRPLAPEVHPSPQRSNDDEADPISQTG